MASSAAVVRRAEGSAVGWSFWLKWFLACLAGFVVGVPLFIGLGLLFGNQPGSVVVENAVTGIIHGAEFGIAQWLILRWQVPKVGWWVAASIVGFMIGFPLTKTSLAPAPSSQFPVSDTLECASHARVAKWQTRQP